MKRIYLLIGAVLTAFSLQVQAADDAAVQAKAAVCAGCHGADGNSVNPEWPNLAGQHPAYLAKQLMDFKAAKTRNNPLMLGQVALLNEEDMKSLADFFSAKTPKGGEADPAKVELGAKIYRAGNATTGVSACSACHGPTGSGNPAANFPRLAGQHAKYTETQLKAFSEGQRSNDAASMMRKIASKMTPDEMAAVAQYIQGLN